MVAHSCQSKIGPASRNRPNGTRRTGGCWLRRDWEQGNTSTQRPDGRTHYARRDPLVPRIPLQRGV
jgi:hypothetical protein